MVRVRGLYGDVLYNLLVGDFCMVTDPSRAQDDKMAGLYGCVFYKVLGGM